MLNHHDLDIKFNFLLGIIPFRYDICAIMVKKVITNIHIYKVVFIFVLFNKKNMFNFVSITFLNLDEKFI